MRTLFVFEVHRGEAKDWFVGYSVSDVERLMLREGHIGQPRDYWITRLPLAHKIAIPCNRKGELVDYHSSRVKRLTCAEWAERRGRGYLCGEDY